MLIIICFIFLIFVALRGLRDFYEKVYKVDFCFCSMRRLNCRGQIWVETVIYTLIGLAIIGLVLAVAKPKIDEKKDEIAIEQAIESLGVINSEIYNVVNAGTGNRRSVDLKIGKGMLVFDMESDLISWILESSYEYSEPGISVPIGRMNVTTSVGNTWEVRLDIEYGVNVTFDERDVGTKELDAAAVEYKLTVENAGRDSSGNIVVDIRAS